MRILIISLFIFLLLAPVASLGETHRLTIAEAIDIALKNNHDLKALEWKTRAGEEDTRIAQKRLYPRLMIEEKFMRTDSPTYSFMAKLNQERFTQRDFLIDSLNNPHDVSDYETSFSFEQPLFMPAINKNIDIALSEQKADIMDYKHKKEEVILNVIKSYLATQTAENYLLVSRRALEDAHKHRKLARIKHDAGTGLYSDLLKAEVAVRDAEVKIVTVQNNLDTARRSLALALGRTEPVETVDDRPDLPLMDINYYIDASLKRSDLEALRQKYRSSLESIKLEKSTFLPEIGMGGKYQLNDHKRIFGAEGTSYMFTLFMRWNLFDATLYHRIKKAEAKANSLKERIASIEKGINFSIHRAYSNVITNQKSLDLSRESLKEAEEALRLVRTRYVNDLAPMIDLIDTQVLLDRARASVVDAENSYLTSLATLYYHSGILSKELITREGYK